MANKIVKNQPKQQKSAGLEITGQLLEYILVAVLLAICVIIPLYLKNGYYQIGDAKFAAYKYIMLAGGISLLVFFACYLYFWIKEKPKWNASVTDWFVLAYFGLMVISVFAGGYYDNALWGYPGWNMGFMSQFSFVLLYFFTSRYGKYWKGVLWALCAAATIVFILGILNRLLIDPLGTYVGIEDYYKNQFLSTLGQATWYASFLVVVLPIGMGVYFYTTQKWLRMISGLYIFIGFCTLVTQNSDSGYFALIGFMLFFFWFAVEQLPRLYRFLEMAAIFLLSGEVMRLLLMWKPNTIIEYDQITRIILFSNLPLVVLALIVIVYMALRGSEKKWKYSVKKAKVLRNILYGMLLVLVAAVIAVIILNAKGKLPQQVSAKLQNTYFDFKARWGNGRGQTWMFTASMFAQESFVHKLFGVGPDCYSSYSTALYADELKEMWWNQVLTNAHNEWFNMLINGGILGAVAYLGIFVSAVKRFSASQKAMPFFVGIGACIVSYMAYNFFCYQQVLCTPYIFILIGVGEYILRENKTSVAD